MANQAFSLGTLASFNGTDGSEPIGAVIVDSAGNIFGTTGTGGASGDGTVFEIVNGSHDVTTLATFDGTNGANPQCSLVRDGAGNLYGTTEAGGANDDGTVFEIAAGSGSVTTLVTFTNGNGGSPLAGLIADGAGTLYGTTQLGGQQGGEVFEIASGGDSVTILAKFTVTNGSVPTGVLTADSAGNLYGTTEYGGVTGDGEVFEIVKGSGAVTVLATFNGANGAVPVGGVIMDGAGNLYGTTSSGGANGDGEVFEVVNGSGAITALATFDGTNGATPLSALFMDGAGNLFGTTYAGGASNDGTVFEIVEGSNSVTTLVTFDGPNGANPASTLTADGAGHLYGTTAAGGASGHGTVYELVAQVAPTIVSEAASPTNATLHTGTVTFTVATSEAVVATGSSLTLNNGAAAIYASGDGVTAPLTYAYAVSPGSDTADLQATALNGSITDNAGNALNNATFTAIDTKDIIDTTSASPVYRFYDTVTNDHFYTLDPQEKASIQANLPTFNYEGTPWSTPDAGPGTTDVFRFYDTVTKTHFLTQSVEEKNSIQQNLPTFKYEGVAFEAYTSIQNSNEFALERFYNTDSKVHTYSASPQETALITSGQVGQGWVDEGASFIVHKPA